MSTNTPKPALPPIPAERDIPPKPQEWLRQNPPGIKPRKQEK